MNPRVGMEYDTSEDAWEFWLKYGRQKGFDVRKHYINKSKNDGKITSRGFVCAKQGIWGPEKEDMIRTSNWDDTRTNCPVKLYVSLVQQKNNLFVFRVMFRGNLYNLWGLVLVLLYLLMCVGL